MASQKRVDNEAFIKHLVELLRAVETQGSVYLEQKRLTRTGEDPVLDATESPYPLIFRVSDGARDRSKRISHSTVVKAKDLDAFFLSYTEALRHGAIGLKKKEKKKRQQA